MSSGYEIGDAQLKEILAHGALAPSSHNTQPWVVKLDSGSLVIGYDPRRRLLVGDPHERELFISLGCFVQSLLLAAKDLGYEGTCQWLGDKPDKIAAVSFAAKTTKSGGRWLELIENRRSDRGSFDNKKIPRELVNSLGSLKVGKSSVVVIDEPEAIEFLAKATHQATMALMSRQDFRNELGQWVRNNWTRRPDGMPGYTQGIPGPVSLLAKIVITKTGKATPDQAKKDSARVAESAAVALVCAGENSPAGWLDAGRLFQLLWLSALSKDIKASAISAAVIWPTTAEEIADKLKLSSEPVALLRLGYREGTPKASPRLSVSQFAR